MAKKHMWYKNGRLIVGTWDIGRTNITDVTQEYFDEFVGINVSYNGDLFLYNQNISNLGVVLENIQGFLDISFCKVGSLGGLRNVSGHLDVCGSHLKALGDLEYVGGYLSIGLTTITTLGGLEYVGDDLYLEESNITSLGDLNFVGGAIHCSHGSPAYELLMNSKFKDQIISSY